MSSYPNFPSAFAVSNPRPVFPPAQISYYLDMILSFPWRVMTRNAAGKCERAVIKFRARKSARAASGGTPSLRDTTARTQKILS